MEETLGREAVLTDGDALPRRMWAGGRFAFRGPIRLGEEVTKTSTIKDIEMKSGRSGPLCFVMVKHELVVNGDLRIQPSG